MIYSVSNTSKERQACFQHGQVVYAKVINHDREFSFYKSKKDYSITVDFINENNKRTRKVLRNKLDLIWKEHPVGSEVIGLVHKDKSFFAEEMGFTFKFYKETAN